MLIAIKQKVYAGRRYTYLLTEETMLVRPVQNTKIDFKDSKKESVHQKFFLSMNCNSYKFVVVQ